ncbi:MAG: hypothetical protein HOW73_04950 [Polyangiaceae bacterium]|nr:hypothetical protein [Polyangiaceae bacterium]
MGVTRAARTWNARLYIERVPYLLGSWPTAKEAAIARDRAILHFGLDHALAFPRDAKRLGPATPEALAKAGRALCRAVNKRKNASGYTGVVSMRGGAAFEARVLFGGQMQHLGQYKTARDAAIARDRALIYLGEEWRGLAEPEEAGRLGPASPEELRSAKTRARRTHRETGLLGVSLAPAGGYVARIQVDGAPKQIGTFALKEDAAVAYDCVARHLELDRSLWNYPDRELDAVPLEDVRKWAIERAIALAEEAGPQGSQRTPYQKGLKLKDCQTWGVHRSSDGRYHAHLFAGGEKRRVNLGYWLTEHEAALARDRAALHFELDLPLNYPDEARALGALSPEELQAQSARKPPPSVQIRRKPTMYSEYRGLTRYKGKWVVMVCGQKCGRFEREQDAAIAHDRAAVALLGSDAILNFPSRRTTPASPAEMRAWGRKLSKKQTTSRFVGVSYNPQHHLKAWIAYAGHHVFVGAWETEREAALAHDRGTLFLGVRAHLNFPDEARALGPASPEELCEEAHRQFKRHTTSQYRGVYWATQTGAWHASIGSGGKTYFLGSYTHEARAAEAYDHAAMSLHGERAKLNFGDTNPRRAKLRAER